MAFKEVLNNLLQQDEEKTVKEFLEEIIQEAEGEK